MNDMSEECRNLDLVTALCHALHTLAKREEDAAASEASRTPYWVACPPSVEAHRTAARLLRADAERLESESRLWAVAS
jgi:hypothetical protein